MIKKITVVGVILGLSVVNVYAGEYASDGKNVYYDGKKLVKFSRDGVV